MSFFFTYHPRMVSKMEGGRQEREGKEEKGKEKGEVGEESLSRGIHG